MTVRTLSKDILKQTFQRWRNVFFLPIITTMNVVTTITCLQRVNWYIYHFDIFKYQYVFCIYYLLHNPFHSRYSTVKILPKQIFYDSRFVDQSKWFMYFVNKNPISKEDIYDNQNNKLIPVHVCLLYPCKQWTNVILCNLISRHIIQNVFLCYLWKINVSKY